jgi:hypothetical protein
MANERRSFLTQWLRVGAVLAGLVSCAWNLVPAAGRSELKLEPVAEDALYAIPPDAPTAIMFRASAPGHPDQRVRFRISDYAGAIVQHDEADLTKDVLQLSVKLAEGFYEVSFDNVDGTFGFTVAAPFSGPTDAFFGLDAGLSWRLSGQNKRQAMIHALQKSGIGVVRERLGWMLVEPSFGRRDWHAKHDYDGIRELYRRSGIKLLECLYGLPGGARLEQSLDPLTAARSIASMTQLAQHWGDLWAGVEVWNEIDLANVDPQRYVRALDLVRQGLRGQTPSIPVVAGAFAKFKEDYLDQLADAGMLQRADALSIHPYGNTQQTREMIGDYRRWTAKRGRPDMPIWISESGRAWPRGRSRPIAVDDTRSARANTIRGVVARAERASAYFPFVFTFYEEKELNYGMTDRSLTPLRSFAAYATLVRILAHASPAAAPQLPGAREAYAFQRGATRIWVVYTEDARRLAAPTGLSGRVYGMDGRDLGPVGGEIPVPDGIAYVVSQ